MSVPKVLYLDNHLLILEKPPGYCTQPEGKQLNLQDWGKDYLKKKFHKVGKVFLEPIHRLDKPASGIVIFARTSKALSRLQAFVREKRFSKWYLALVEGDFPSETASLEDFLEKGSQRTKVAPPSEKSQVAISEVFRIRHSSHNSLLLIRLDTGRYHQIRVQLASRGFPLVGDTKYGAKPQKTPGIALRHIHCSIPHPVQAKTVSVTALSSNSYFKNIPAVEIESKINN